VAGANDRFLVYRSGYERVEIAAKAAFRGVGQPGDRGARGGG
jgi:hypothetical protein